MYLGNPKKIFNLKISQRLKLCFALYSMCMVLCVLVWKHNYSTETTTFIDFIFLVLLVHSKLKHPQADKLLIDGPWVYYFHLKYTL